MSGEVATFDVLHSAIQNNAITTVRHLVRQGADLRRMNSVGHLPLHTAAKYGRDLILLYLLEKSKMPIDEPTSAGQTALHLALLHGQTGCVRLLVGQGANAGATDAQGLACVHAAAMGDNLECVRTIVRCLNKQQMLQVYMQRDEEVTAVDLAQDSNVKKTLAARIKSESYLTEIIYSILPTSMTHSVFVQSVIGALFLPVFYLCVSSSTAATIAFVVSVPFVLTAFAGDHGNQISAFAAWVTQSFMFNGLYMYFVYIIWTGLFGVKWFLLGATSVFIYMGVLLKIVKGDPGYLPKERDIEVFFDSIDEKTPLSELCTVCWIHKPYRTSHCRTCERCVQAFDHHCPWTYNCVGLRNHRQFIVWLLLTIWMAVMYQIMLFAYMQDATGSLNPLVWYHYGPAMTAVGVVHFLGCCYSGALLNSHLILAFKDQTTNEIKRSKPYKYMQDAEGKFFNPFSRGSHLKNFLAFWRKGHTNTIIRQPAAAK
eukprot:TRINITY_DN5652_c0_g1_i1.p1 TRINITY_DN5652_c0_g1~~TRINITY_DN5652_c0_g1_i1.p1  ORF type:complete len:484 (-),score=87.90 TRINITY_DN5652_c0_g1_i1:119-1570(-)